MSDRDELHAAARALASAEKWAKALSKYERLVAAVPEPEPRLLLELAEVHVKLGRYDDAVRVRDRAAQRHLRESLVLKAIGILRQSVTLLAEHPSPEREVHHTDALEKLATLFESLGLGEEAVAARAEATRLRDLRCKHEGPYR